MSVRPQLERRVLAALEASPPRLPVLAARCGMGRTSLLRGLRERLGASRTQYIDVERAASTPERLLRAVIAASRFAAHDVSPEAASPRDAFDALLAFFRGARASDGGPVIFLLDEVLEFRTFENFPGLRHVLRDLVEGLAASTNRCVLATRYVTRALRFLRNAPPSVELITVGPLEPGETRDLLTPTQRGDDDLVRAVHALTEGHCGYAASLSRAMDELGADPVSALTALIAPGGALDREIGHSYELRLHRARGYGALKGILEILAEEEPLTLTEIALRLQRTPGSTKDYLSWLEDVDLIAVHQKRYAFADPLLRLWVRIHCRPEPADEAIAAQEVQQYALARLPHPEPVLAGSSRRGGSGIIEID
ncbi:MAG TPA: hypothetical protein VF198_05830 [Vicinamibacterales bacterium]